MNEFLPMITERDGVPVTTSRVVAEQFGKQHKHVLRDIEVLLEQLRTHSTEPNFGLSTADFAEKNFLPITYRDSTGRELPSYLLTRDGFTLLAMGFTGARALQFKVAYINAFNRMERILRGGGLSSGNLQRIEERLSALEGVADNGRIEAGTSVAALFLQAIKEALASGEYCLREKLDAEDKRDAAAWLQGHDIPDELDAICDTIGTYRPGFIKALWSQTTSTDALFLYGYQTGMEAARKAVLA